MTPASLPLCSGQLGAVRHSPLKDAHLLHSTPFQGFLLFPVLLLDSLTVLPGISSQVHDSYPHLCLRVCSDTTQTRTLAMCRSVRKQLEIQSRVSRGEVPRVTE